MVKDQLEQLTMVRLALDVGSAMQYLAEAGFVVRLPLRLRLRLPLRLRLRLRLRLVCPAPSQEGLFTAVAVRVSRQRCSPRAASRSGGTQRAA
jgi:hypothetical protein